MTYALKLFLKRAFNFKNLISVGSSSRVTLRISENRIFLKIFISAQKSTFRRLVFNFEIMKQN